MNTMTARRLAESAMRQYGLTTQGWVFQWDNAKNRNGMTIYRYKVLTFSKFRAEHADEENFMGTVMHEIAHALVGPGHGHGIVWRKKMLELGQSPNRCREANEAQIEAKKAAANYVITCAVSGDVLGHMDRLVKQRRTKTGLRKYLGHKCKCHNTFALYNGKTFELA